MTIDSSPSRGLFAVDGGRLVVTSPAVLPMRCIKTNIPVSANQMQTETLRYISVPTQIYLVLMNVPRFMVYYALAKCFWFLFADESGRVPSWIGLAYLFSFWAVAFVLSRLTAYFVRNLIFKCRVTYGVHPTAYRRRNGLIAVGVIGMTFGTCYMCGAFDFLFRHSQLDEITELWFLALTVTVFLVGYTMIGLVARESLLRVHLAVSQPHEGKFWISGCDTSFLDSLPVSEAVEVDTRSAYRLLAECDDSATFLSSAIDGLVPHSWNSDRVAINVIWLALFGSIFWFAATVRATSLLILGVFVPLVMMPVVVVLAGSHANPGDRLRIPSNTGASLLIWLLKLVSIEAAIALALSPWIRV